MYVIVLLILFYQSFIEIQSKFMFQQKKDESIISKNRILLIIL